MVTSGVFYDDHNACDYTCVNLDAKNGVNGEILDEF